MAKKQNIVFKRQNEVEMQELVLTQHFTYKSAKKWSGFLFILMVLVPTSINVFLWFNESDIVAGYIAFTSIVIIILGEIISDKIQSEKNKAAMIQQKFDLYVFNMGNISFIDENVVALQIAKYKKKEWSRKKDWYPNYEHMESSKTIFYCQKENVEWTKNLSERYRFFLRLFISIILVSFVYNMIYSDSSIIRVLSLLAIALPIVSYTLSYSTTMRRVDREFFEVESIVKGINDNLQEISIEKLKKMSYALQILIYKYRQKRYLIPDWFENRLFSRMQKVENIKAGQRKRRDKETKKKI